MRTFFIALTMILGTQLCADELKLKEARALVEGAIAEARELGIRIGVAVYDRHGNMKAFAQMDRATRVAGESA